MLAEFGSAVSAVAAAIDIQERMAAFNQSLDEASACCSASASISAR